MKRVRQHNNPSLRLVVDCVSLSIATIDLAVDMAVSVKTPLQVIFIEDADLLRIAGLPFASEICRSTAQQKPTDEDQMLRSLRSRASQFRESLQQAAQSSGIVWHYDFITGKVADIVLQTDLEYTYTILGSPISHRILSRNYRRTRKVLLTGKPAPQIKLALQVVLKQFNTENIEITLIPFDQPSRSSMLEMVQQINAAEKRITVIEPQPEQLTRILSGMDTSFDCAIFSHPEEAGIQHSLIANLACPLILIA